jgi:RNA polymerase sigma-70 factor (sigma-E family)
MQMQDDEAAFHEFVVSRASALSRTAYLLTGDFHLAEDLVQTALFKAAKSWHRIEGDAEAYVRRILYTQNISWWRARRHVAERPLETYHDRAAAAEDHDLRMSLEKALVRLTPKQRTVLVLRYYEDLTEVETARVLGIGVGTVKSQSRQALARLRALAPHLGELVRTEAGR